MINQFADVSSTTTTCCFRQRWRPAAFPVGDYPEVIEGKRNAHVKGWGFLPFTHPINMIGHTRPRPCPAASHADGLPIGLHIVGRKGDEETVLAASAAFERAMPWADKRPAGVVSKVTSLKIAVEWPSKKGLPALSWQPQFTLCRVIAYFEMKSNWSYWPFVVTCGSMLSQRSAMVEYVLRKSLLKCRSPSSCLSSSRDGKSPYMPPFTSPPMDECYAA